MWFAVIGYISKSSCNAKMLEVRVSKYKIGKKYQSSLSLSST